MRTVSKKPHTATRRLRHACPDLPVRVPSSAEKGPRPSSRPAHVPPPAVPSPTAGLGIFTHDISTANNRYGDTSHRPLFHDPVRNVSGALNSGDLTNGTDLDGTDTDMMAIAADIACLHETIIRGLGNPLSAPSLDI